MRGGREVMSEKEEEEEEERGGVLSFTWPWSYDPRPSHPYYTGTEHVGFSPTRQTSFPPSAKRREVFGESHKGWTASFKEPLVRQTSAPCAHFLAYG